MIIELEPRYAPLAQNEAGTSREMLVTGPPSSMQPLGELETAKKWYKRRLTLILTPFTIAITLGFVVIAALFGRWITQGKKTNGVSIADVGRLPFMGYNTWNEYQCDINESVILDTARLIKSYGLLDYGYNYVNVDDCYAEKTRDSNGNIVAHKERFPNGMKHLTDTIHGLGMKAGIYSDSGWFTCQLYPGSYMNEERDIKLFQDEWGFDMLKYDNCAVPFDEVIKEGMVGKFTRMSNAIKKQSELSGKPPILFSLCQWGRVQPWLWARELGQTWRSTPDIYPEWISVASIINDNSFVSWATDFYGRNDLDMLEVGHSKLTYDEQKAHFTAWALMKSPLLIGTDMSKITQEALSILKNAELIAINQDPVVGTAITPFRWGINPDWTFNRSHPAQYWSGESQNGTIIMLLNTLDEPADMTFRLVESPWIRAGRQYTVRDLWAHTDNGTAVRSYTAKNVPRHGVVALLLKDAGDEPSGTLPPCSTPEWCMDQNGTRIDQ